MGSDIFAVMAPQCQLLAGIGEAVEYLLIRDFVPQAAVEAFDEPIFLRLVGVDMQATPVSPARKMITVLVNSVPIPLTMQSGLP